MAEAATGKFLPLRFFLTTMKFSHELHAAEVEEATPADNNTEVPLVEAPATAVDELPAAATAEDELPAAEVPAEMEADPYEVAAADVPAEVVAAAEDPAEASEAVPAEPPDIKASEEVGAINKVVEEPTDIKDDLEQVDIKDE